MNDITLIQNKIYEIRGQRVMLDFDLVALYQVTTSAMNQAVKRNAERFPEEFMFSYFRKRMGTYLITICYDIPDKASEIIFAACFYRIRCRHVVRSIAQ